MRNKCFAAAACSLLLGAGLLSAHDDETLSGSSSLMARKLAFVIPGLYGDGGLTLPNPTHKAHFDSAFQTNFVPFNAAIASQLTSLPIPSPASGFTYTFDKTLGVYSRSAQSFGPVLTERSETIGRGKMLIGFAYQRFRFDKIDGIDLNRVPSVFNHIPNPANPTFAQDVITTDNAVDLNIGQFTTFVTYGLSDRVDISVAMPVVSASLRVTSKATIHRIGTFADPTIHSFSGTGDQTQATFANEASAAGLGDIVVRAKGTVMNWERGGLALGLDTRLPTGDEYNFLGSGAYGVKPFAALSLRYGKLAPHANIAYQYNGKSVLAGDVALARREKLPAQYLYAAGADLGVTEKFTLAFDLIGQQQTGAQRIRQEQFLAGDGEKFQQISFRKGSVNETNAAVGFKLNPFGRLLFSFNVLVNVNEGGLRARVVPLFGISYTL